jgi:membrane-associated protease RseP (regulator of RpoE activity)
VSDVDGGGTGPATEVAARVQRWREGVVGGYGTAPAGPEPDPRRSLFTLAVVVAAAVVVSALGHFLGVVATIAVIAAVIMLHEFGHFAAAKLGGMKVTEYFLGFGPRLWSVRKGETEYGVKAIPAGGYCRIVGMNNLEQVDPVDEPRTYRQATFWRRFAVGVAGSTMHFVLALVAVWTLFAFAHQKPEAGVGQLATLSRPTPAQRAGLEPGDRFVSVDGHRVTSWTMIHDYIRDHDGKPIDLVVRRGPADVAVTVTPVDAATVKDTTGTPISTDHYGFLGISPSAANYSLLGAIPESLETFWDEGVVGTFSAIGGIFSPHGLASIGRQVVSKPGASTPAEAGDRPVSVIGVVEIAGQMPGWAEKVLLFFEANAFVGMVNLFPILPFDGGHVVIAIYEAIRSRKGRRYRADVNKMVPYAMAMMVVMAMVFVSTLYLDVAHPITLH